MKSGDDPFRLDGRRILVTGAGSDIGRAIAAACADAGASVVASGRDPSRLARTEAMLASRGNEHACVPADLVDAVERERLATAASGIDGLVYAASVTGPMLGRSVTARHLHERFEANYFAPMLLIRELLAANAVNDGGSLVFISSISAVVGTRGMSVYAATKASQIASARCLALELGPKRIRVNCIAPAIVKTDVYDGLGEHWLKEQAERYPLGLGLPRDVALAALFLLAPASRWITGETMVLSGASSWV